MFQAQNTETINSTRKIAVSFKMTTSVTRPGFNFHNTPPDLQDQDQDRFLVSDRSCPKTDGLRPYHCTLCVAFNHNFYQIFPSNLLFCLSVCLWVSVHCSLILSWRRVVLLSDSVSVTSSLVLARRDRQTDRQTDSDCANCYHYSFMCAWAGGCPQRQRTNLLLLPL